MNRWHSGSHEQESLLKAEFIRANAPMRAQCVFEFIEFEEIEKGQFICLVLSFVKETPSKPH